MKFLPLLALVVASSAAYADGLGPGSPAPALSIRSWVKGEPVPTLEKNKTYVVEFWATWCGPCIESIPHLTEIAHKNPDITFIGVSVWEDDKDGSVKKFVDNMGAKMDYHVAYSGNQDGMAVSWMKPASQDGIPAAFIVKNGVIQWIGHPMELEAPLTQVKAGTFDLDKYRKVFATKAARNQARMQLQEDLSSADKLFQDGKRKEAKDKLAEIDAKNPKEKAQTDSMRFAWLAKEDPKAWESQAQALAKTKKPDDLQKLRSFALGQASDPKGAFDAARKAMDLALGMAKPDDTLTLQYGALVFERMHDIPRALDCTNKMLAVIPNNADNAELRKAMEKKKAELEALPKSK